MKVDVFIQKSWNIPKRLKNQFNKENLETTLLALNQICGKKFYFVDYQKQEIIVDSQSSPILCGYPKELLEQECFGFYQRILGKEDWHWLVKMNEEAYKILFITPEHERKYITVSYDLFVEPINGQRHVVHHKIVPYQLCKNGNAWIGLCFITVSSSEKSGHPTIINSQTGARYEFLKDVFVRCDNPSLTNEELSIIEWMVKGLSAVSIGHT